MKNILFVALICSLGCNVLYSMEGGKNTQTRVTDENKGVVTKCETEESIVYNKFFPRASLSVTKYTCDFEAHKAGEFSGYTETEYGRSDKKDPKELYKELKQEYKLQEKSAQQKEGQS